MVIFHSYVCLPEGTLFFPHLPGEGLWILDFELYFFLLREQMGYN